MNGWQGILEGGGAGRRWTGGDEYSRRTGRQSGIGVMSTVDVIN
jgi:hypothetical protein